MTGSPVFLVGTERSGTTMLRLMLDAHPQISFQGEYEFLVDLIAPDGTLPSREKFDAHVSTDRIFNHWRLPLTPGLDFKELANSFITGKQAAKDAKVGGATVHRHFDRLLHIWPDGRFIHIVRDGRDVALSRIAMGWAGNAFTAIGEWIEVEALWNALEAKLPSDRHITIRYEELVGDPASQLERICEFLGLRYDKAMLDYDEHSTYSKPVRSAPKWRSLPPAQLVAAEFRAARSLEQAGYALSQTPRAPTRTYLWASKVHDRIYRLNFRRRRYGARLWLEDILSRRLGSRRWRQSVMRRIWLVEERNLK